MTDVKENQLPLQESAAEKRQNSPVYFSNWPELKDHGWAIAKYLKEAPYAVVRTIGRIVGVLGLETTRQLADEAHKIFAGDGLLTNEGNKRTIGGIFFYLVKTKIDKKLWLKISPPKFAAHKSNDNPPVSAPPPAKQPSKQPVKQLDPEQISVEFERIQQEATSLEKGAASTVKITIVGRPGKVQHTPTFVSFTLESEKAPSLPKGLPEIKTGTQYLIMVATKQWKNVETALATNKEDKLIIEGYPTTQPGFKGICVLASKVTSKEQSKAVAEELRAKQSQQSTT